MSTLEFKWTVSRGRDTYGYNICTLYVDGVKRGRCNGGGYDMQGTALGAFIETEYKDRLLALKPEDMDPQSHWQKDEEAWICREHHEQPCDMCCDRETCDKHQFRLADCIFCNGSGLRKDAPVRQRAAWDAFPNCRICGEVMVKDWNAGRRVDDGRYFYGLTFHDPNYDPGKAVIGQDCSNRTFDKQAEGKTVAQAEAEGNSFGLERYQAVYSASSKVPTERHTIPSIDGACGMSSVERIMKAIGLRLQLVPTRRNSRGSVYLLHDENNPRKEDHAA